MPDQSTSKTLEEIAAWIDTERICQLARARGQTPVIHDHHVRQAARMSGWMVALRHVIETPYAEKEKI